MKLKMKKKTEFTIIFLFLVNILCGIRLLAQTPGPSGLYATMQYGLFPNATYVKINGISQGLGVGPIQVPLNGASQFYLPSATNPVQIGQALPVGASLPAGEYEYTSYGPNGNVATYSNFVSFDGTTPAAISGSSFLPPGLRGRLLNSQGNPIPHYKFLLNRLPYNQIAFSYIVETDANGIFVAYYFTTNSNPNLYQFIPIGQYTLTNLDGSSLGPGLGTTNVTYYSPNSMPSSGSYYLASSDYGDLTVSNIVSQ